MSDKEGPSASRGPRDRIEWLLSFLGRDLETLRPGDWMNLRDDVQRHLLSTDIEAADFEASVRELHKDLRHGLEAISGKTGWILPNAISRNLIGFTVKGEDVIALYENQSPAVALMSSAFDLLIAWYPSLRRCRQCKAWFLPRHGRQKFHDPVCSTRARWQRFAPKRSRDYHQEYARKVKRKKRAGKP